MATPTRVIQLISSLYVHFVTLIALVVYGWKNRGIFVGLENPDYEHVGLVIVVAK
jgi:hypothetical protein